MARLIDADALCKRIREIYDGYMLDEGCTPIEFENMVDEQPTAYDVEKVVEGLNNHPNVFQEHEGSYIPLEDAIDIVRKGGVE